MTTETRTATRSQLESKLEEKFTLKVRKLLRGRTMKIIPTEKGAPDRLVLLPGGRIELVELKADAGRLSPRQRLWHDRAAMLDIKVHVITGEAEMLAWVASMQARN